MNPKGMSILGMLMSCFMVLPAQAREYPCNALTLPALVECEGEGCGASYNRALAEADILVGPDVDAPVVGRIKKCDLLKDMRFYTQVTKYGEVVVKGAPNPEFHKAAYAVGVQDGDILKMVQDVGEGYSALCIGDDILQMPHVPLEPEMEAFRVEIRQRPTGIQWVRVAIGIDNVGYIRDFPGLYMGRYDYQPSRMCDQ